MGGGESVPCVHAFGDRLIEFVQLPTAGQMRMTSPSGSPNSVAEKRELLRKLLRERAATNPERPRGIPPRPDRTEPARLSFNQERLWLIDQLQPDGTAYTIPFAFRLRGSLDRGAFEGALREIIRRHESLRTRFAAGDDGPRQVVDPPDAVPIEHVDLSQHPEAERDGAAWALADRLMTGPFNLATGPLFRTALITIAPADHIFVMVFHHVISDGWSVQVFLRELVTLYRTFASGETTGLAELPIQYQDFAAWHRDWAESPAAIPHLTYWKERLAGAPAALELPTDRPRPPVRTFRAGRQTLEVSGTTEQALATLCRSEQTTPFVGLLAAFATVLHRLSGQNDILIGSPYAGRGQPETESLIGFFVNTVVLRTDLAGQPAFRDLLRQVRIRTREAHTHQDVPFERVVAELKPAPDPSRTALFQVFFNLLGFAADTFQLPGVEIEPRGGVPDEAKFDLTLYAQELRPGYRFVLVYNADLFEEARITEILAQYHQALDQMISNPDSPVADLSLVTPGAAAILPDPAIPLPTEWTGSIPDRITSHAARDPDRIAVSGAGADWTYRELDQASNRIANHLVGSGLGPGSIVAVYAGRDPTLPLALLGILKAGAAFTVLDPAYPAERLVSNLAEASPVGWIALEAAGPIPDALDRALDATALRARLTIGPATALASLLPGTSNEHPGTTIEPETVAYLAFTSGTTGTPRGIVGTHRPLSHFLAWYQSRFDLGAADRVSMLSGLAHDPLLRDLFTPLWIGGTLVVPDPTAFSQAGALSRWIRTERVTVTHLTPPLLDLISTGAEPDSLPWHDLRLACFGGDRLTTRHIAMLRRLAPSARQINGYGATETPQLMAGFEIPDGPLTDPVPLGAGIDGAQLLVMTPADGLAGIGELGEIAVRTPYLSQGYLNDRDTTARRFSVNPYTRAAADRIYRTGDLGRYGTDGLVRFAGRADRQLKIRGFRVELAEVERALLALPGAAETVALADTDPTGNARLVAYLVGNWTTAPAPEEIRHHLATLLPAYAVPSIVTLLAALPRTPNGKVDHRALPASEPASTPAERTSPRDTVELRLCRLWEEALELEAVGIHDDFFAIGGHSLVAVRLFAAIEKEFGRRLSLAVLLAAPTVAQLADVLRDATRPGSSGAIVPIETRGARRPFFCVHGIGGNVLNYVDLARQLGAEQPFYGLQAIGLDGHTPPLQTIDAMARRYLEDIRTVQPHGPYRLGGGCMGGIIAHTMARQLQQAGEQVELLVLLDVPAPRPLTWRDRLGRWVARHPTLRKPARLANRVLVWWQLPPERRWARLRSVFTRAGTETMEPVREARAQEATRTEVQHANYFAMKSHRAGVFQGRIVHFFSDRPPDNGLGDRRLAWATCATDGQEVIPIGGGDSGLMLTRPHVELLGQRLGEVLARPVPSHPAASSKAGPA